MRTCAYSATSRPLRARLSKSTDSPTAGEPVPHILGAIAPAGANSRTNHAQRLENRGICPAGLLPRSARIRATRRDETAKLRSEAQHDGGKELERFERKVGDVRGEGIGNASRE